MFTARYKALAFSLATVLLFQCREPVNLMKRADPTENRHSVPENKNREGISPAIKEGKPEERERDKPAIQTSDTLLPKRA